ncbi:MAG: DUF4331 domain-containing protein [Chloroflexi bacterium]|nr:DUF4331 domain-containing protein [Chloroflexota bacterium]
MSSHREAPAISQDPVADNTDLYAFVDPNDSSKVTILANYIPLEEPAGGPNFHQFGDDVLYEIMIDNDGDAVEDITYQFRFTTQIGNPNTFLYNVNQINSLADSDWNMRQTYSVTKVLGPRRTGKATVLASGLASPPDRIGPLSTPNYDTNLVPPAIHSLTSGEKVFAGQREEGFFVDLGAVFELGTLRPFQNFHLIGEPAAAGVDATKGFNVHTIALQVPKTDLTRDGSTPTNPLDAKSVIGVWASASRQRATVRDAAGGLVHHAGPWVQVSRLGNPLINEVIIPLGKKDLWNSLQPRDDAQFLQYYENPELAALLPGLYPGVFTNLDALNTSGAARAELVAILLTGIPAGIPGLPATFQTFTGPVQADMLRLNMAIPASGTPNPLGLLGGPPADVAAFPNGRRHFDNVVAIELRVVAGTLYPLIDGTFTPDGAAGLLTDGTANDVAYLSTFPYLGTPHEGYEHFHD